MNKMTFDIVDQINYDISVINIIVVLNLDIINY